MLGWQIFVHSVRMVFGNLKQVFQIAVGPAAVGTIILIAIFAVLGIPADFASVEQPGSATPMVSGRFAVFMICALFVAFTIMFWVAVSWHRFILLEEYPTGLLPSFRFDRILAYFGRLILLGLLMMIGYLPAVLIISGIGVSLALVVLIPYALFLLVCFYRLSIILPAAAIGENITLSQAWNSTTNAGGAILVLLLVAIVFQIIVQFVLSVLAAIPILGVLLSLFFGSLILPLINVSLLTTMYGIFIEKRDLT